MVMKHRKYNYNCVIYGWDPICKATKVNIPRAKWGQITLGVPGLISTIAYRLTGVPRVSKNPKKITNKTVGVSALIFSQY